MQLITLKITNFRSFGPNTQTLTFNNKLNCLVGHNSSGKTAALEALRKLFGDRIERTLYREDFHIAHDEDPTMPTQKSLQLEAELNFLDDENGIEEFGEDYVIDQPGGTPFVRIKLVAIWSPSITSLEGEIDAKHLIMTEPGGGDQEEKWKDLPREKHALFQLIYVPALRKTADQLRYASGSVMHRLMRSVEFTEAFRGEVRDQVSALNQLIAGLPGFDSIQQTLRTTWSRFHRDQRFSDATMSFGAGEVEEIMRKIEMQFSPGVGQHRRFGVDDLGDGYRSLFYITLVCVMLQTERARPRTEDGEILPVMTILVVEEPENHIAPQLLGRVIKILQHLVSQHGLQLMLSSHTPAIIKRLTPESIHHFRLSDEAATEVNNIVLPDADDEAYKYIKEAVQNYPEIYFAKLVVIGEGDTEDVIFRHMMRVFNADFDENSVTFAPLGHRFVHHIWRLLAQLQIPNVTLLDLDLGRPGGGWGRIQYAVEELLAAGADRNHLLRYNGGVFTDAEVRQISQRLYTDNWSHRMDNWRRRLEEFNVFYSGKLDLDFLMLKVFEQFYTGEGIVPQGYGPKFRRAQNTEAYTTYLEGAVKAALKTDEIIPGLYTDEESHLMIWYRYHFLNRGKPGTHMEALASIPDDDFLLSAPAELQAVFQRITNLIVPHEEDPAP